MRTLFKNANVYDKGKIVPMDVAFSDSRMTDVSSVSYDRSFDLKNCLLIPGLVDVHVHLREPGFSYKETIKTGTSAAAKSGYTALCAMPNLSPAPDSPENVAVQAKIIKKDACVRVYPYGTITKGQKGAGELTDFKALQDAVIAFSDDGRGVQEESLMREAMERVHALGGLIAAHCEDNALLHGGYIHDGEYAKLHHHKGISSESEWGQIARDLRLAKETGCRYHVCHISTKESVDLIRKAKREGVDVTCETAPHYLVLNDMDLEEDGRFKMNPPIRSEKDREALIEGTLDGTIDMIATDHAPHSREEKSRGLENSLMGVTGLECAFPILYTELVKKGILPLERLICMMTDAPRKRFHITGGTAVGDAADLAVWRLDKKYQIDSNNFLSLGHATPFDGRTVYGECMMTVVGGEIKWQKENW